MTNDEIRRNDEIRMTKPATAQLRVFRHSGFGFHSSFVIGHSSFVIGHSSLVIGHSSFHYLKLRFGTVETLQEQENIFTLFLYLAVASGLKISPCEPGFYSAPLAAGK